MTRGHAVLVYLTLRFLWPGLSKIQVPVELILFGLEDCKPKPCLRFYRLGVNQ